MLFVGTIRENLLYGNADASDERLDEVAADAHADIFIRDLAKGYGELVGERGITLSAGQRQSLAIARVMLERPRVLILEGRPTPWTRSRSGLCRMRSSASCRTAPPA
jgi:ABC-type multidrug transport system fused ATPase/permease subunit